MTDTQQIEPIDQLVDRVAGRFTRDPLATPVIEAAKQALKDRDGQIADQLRLVAAQEGLASEMVEKALVNAGLVTAQQAPDVTAAVNTAVDAISAAAEKAIADIRSLLQPRQG